MFRARGYQVTATGNVDPATLRSLSQQNLGFLYIFTHGLEDVEPVTNSNQEPQLGFGLATSLSATSTSLSSDDKADIQAGRLTPGEATTFVKNPDGTVSNGQTLNVFYATRAFFDFYWKAGTFAQGSVVFVNGCFSADTEFQTTCSNAGAGLVIGWTFPCLAVDGAATADFVFDRFLGTNNPAPTFFPEAVPQRPFDWNSISANMSVWTAPPESSFVNGNKLGVSSTTTWGGAAISASPAGGDAQLVPSIFFLGLNENMSYLYVNGSFGPGPPNSFSVTISDTPSTGGSTLNVVTWTPKMLTCDLPQSGGATPAAGASGYVVVTVNGVSSNCVPLTQWSGTAVATAQGDQQLQETITYGFSLRLDAHHCRTDFKSSLGPSSYASYPLKSTTTKDSTCSFVATGSAVYTQEGGGAVTDTLSGSGSVYPATTVVDGAQSFDPATVFSVNMNLEWQLDGKLNETHTISWTFGNPGQTGNQENMVVMTTESENETSQNDIWAFQMFQFTNPMTLLSNSTSYKIPSPGSPVSPINRPALSTPWNTATLQINSSTLAPPDPTKGEDYLPVLSSSG